MKRDAAQTIFRTVVFAGAMLGAPACAKKAPPATPPTNAAPAATDPVPAADTEAPTADVSEDPCAGGEYDPCTGERPRGTDEDGGGGMGRGFILS